MLASLLRQARVHHNLAWLRSMSQTGSLLFPQREKYREHDGRSITRVAQKLAALQAS